MFEMALATPDGARPRNSVYGMIADFCLFALCNPLKRQAIRPSKFYAASHNDQITAHSLLKNCNCAQQQCSFPVPQ
jgi:hypothetical protein